MLPRTALSVALALVALHPAAASPSAASPFAAAPFAVLAATVAMPSDAIAGAPRAADAFAVLFLDELPVDAAHDHVPPFAPALMWPFARLDGPGEVFLGRERDEDLQAERARIAVRAPAGAAVRVTLQYPGEGGEPGDVVAFELGPADFTADEAAFRDVERSHYERLLEAGLPGAAWFRHRRDAAAGAAPTAADAGAPRRGSGVTVEDSYELFTGGRAVSENLQLDRTLPVVAPDEDTVAIDAIEGIATRGYDWSALVDGVSPELDPLAGVVPADQHVVFFPGVGALLAVLGHAEAHGAPVLAALEPRAETAGTRGRYERQLGVPLDALSRLLGAVAVGSVAVTGSDPYLRTGSDVALLLEGDPALLEPLLRARVALSAEEQGVEPQQGRAGDGTAWWGARTPDRTLCSYLARIGPRAVALTNSLAQLERLLAAARGEVAALVSLDEYVFFRDRYRRGDADETALLVLSDATIRRWCGPRWRIGSSRRSRAAAVLSEYQARAAAAIVSGATDALAGAAPLEPDPALPDVGALRLTGAGVTSDVYGDLLFATPIVELPLERVSEAEADVYLRWRLGYERNWSQWFDPIAIRFTVDEQVLAADVTVRPLIAGTEYRDYLEMAAGASIGPHGGDPHDGALLHWVTAFDRDASSLARQEAVSFARMVVPAADPLGWLGTSIAVYADRDPYWAELAASDLGDDGFLLRELHRLPVALHADVADPLQLALFLSGARAFIEQTAPGNLVWENVEHAGRTYVRVSPSDQALADVQAMDEVGADWTPPALHYVAGGQGLLLSLSEDVVKRAIERHVARAAARAGGAGDPAHAAPDAASPRAGQPGDAEPRDTEPGDAERGDARGDAAPPAGGGLVTGPWLGRHLALRAHADVVDLLERGLVTHEVQPLQRIAWENLPVLDEWRRLWPDRDPLAVHEQLWGRRLVCPGGGAYRWNAQDGRMESTLYGHPGRPRKGPVLPVTVQSIGSAELGVDFEDDGLRARARLGRAAAAARPEAPR